MTLWLATLLLTAALIGIALAYRYLPKNSTVQILCLIACTLPAIACAVYIALTVLFINAVSSRPPAP